MEMQFFERHPDLEDQLIKFVLYDHRDQVLEYPLPDVMSWAVDWDDDKGRSAVIYGPDEWSSGRYTFAVVLPAQATVLYNTPSTVVRKPGPVEATVLIDKPEENIEPSKQKLSSLNPVIKFKPYARQQPVLPAPRG